MFTSIVRRRLLVALASSATRSLRFSCRAAPLTATASVVQYVESTLEQEKPSEAVRLPGSNLLSHEFLIRQSCAVSSESASTVLTHVVVAIQDSVDKYLKASDLKKIPCILEAPFIPLECSVTRILCTVKSCNVDHPTHAVVVITDHVRAGEPLRRLGVSFD